MTPRGGGPQLLELTEQFVNRHGGRPELGDDDTRGVVGKRRGFRAARSGRERKRERRDHGERVAGMPHQGASGVPQSVAPRAEIPAREAKPERVGDGRE